jgi:hypothetical protein
MSKGVYNQTYFDNHPEEKDKPGVLYGVILVNQKTLKRECIKVGIAKGKNWKDVVKRAQGFTGYEVRIQRTYHDTLYNVWKLEQSLHKKFEADSYKPEQKFGGHTECFRIGSRILRDIPKNKS